MNRKQKYEQPELEELEMMQVVLMGDTTKREDLDDTEEEDEDI